MYVYCTCIANEKSVSSFHTFPLVIAQQKRGILIVVVDVKYKKGQSAEWYQ